MRRGQVLTTTGSLAVNVEVHCSTPQSCTNSLLGVVMSLLFGPVGLQQRRGGIYSGDFDFNTWAEVGVTV